MFLTKIEDQVHAAEIIGEDAVAQIEKLCNIRIAQGGKKADGVKENILFCYVVLRTEEFRGGGAHFRGAKEGRSDLQFDEIYCSLDKEDLVSMKKEILAGPLPTILKDAVRDIDI